MRRRMAIRNYTDYKLITTSIIYIAKSETFISGEP